jgi:hypothetical protein
VFAAVAAVAVAVTGGWAARDAGARPTPTTWCGGSSVEAADRKPDLLAGRQIDVLYARPADVPDRFGTFASKITSDIAAIDAWWRAQDGTRTLRFDLYPFPGCAPGVADLDLADVTLPQPAASYRAVATAFSRIVSDLQTVPYKAISPDRKYLVYWDAPVSDWQLCGQGSADATDYTTGPSWAIVYVQSCLVSIGNGDFGALAATHELLHTLGAVPPGAPHDCPYPNQGHVCDSTKDILYPFQSGAFGFDDLVLDVNHDDYYGVGGAFDIRNSPWLERLDLPQVPLTVATDGPGSGRVTSDEGAIDCPGACTSSQQEGLGITLTATPASGSTFAGWSGACAGTAPCAVTFDEAKQVTATFTPDTSYALVVAVHGKGRVVSSPAGVSCPGRCSGSFYRGSVVRLRAVPAKGFRLAAWGGACSGRRACSVTLGAASSVRARFVKA